MTMPNCLACSRPVIDADVVAVRCKLTVQLRPGLFNQVKQIVPLRLRQLEEGADMPSGNDQRMAGRNGVIVENANAAGIAGQ
jgi:hypothetical protein